MVTPIPAVNDERAELRSLITNTLDEHRPKWQGTNRDACEWWECTCGEEFVSSPRGDTSIPRVDGGELAERHLADQIIKALGLDPLEGEARDSWIGPLGGHFDGSPEVTRGTPMPTSYTIDRSSVAWPADNNSWIAVRHGLGKDVSVAAYGDYYELIAASTLPLYGEEDGAIQVRIRPEYSKIVVRQRSK